MLCLKSIREERSQRQYLLNDLQRGLQDEFDSKLVQQLQELRNEYEEMIKNVRAEVEGKSEGRLRDLMVLSDRNAETAVRLQDELEEWRKRHLSLQPEVDRLRKEVRIRFMTFRPNLLVWFIPRPDLWECEFSECLPLGT